MVTGFTIFYFILSIGGAILGLTTYNKSKIHDSKPSDKRKTDFIFIFILVLVIHFFSTNTPDPIFYLGRLINSLIIGVIVRMAFLKQIKSSSKIVQNLFDRYTLIAIAGSLIGVCVVNFVRILTIYV